MEWMGRKSKEEDRPASGWRGGPCEGHNEKRASLGVTGALGLRNEEEEE